MAHTFDNIGFEDPHATLKDTPEGVTEPDDTYIPEAWAGVESVAGEGIAAFVAVIDGGPLTWYAPHESFGFGWGANESALFAFTDSDLDAALFNGPALLSLIDYDGFESKWDGNEAFWFVMGSTAAAEFGTSVETFDGFESEWSDNEDFAFDIGDTSQTAASFDATPQSVEDFEHEWRDNESFAFDVGDTSQSSASFDDGSAETVEDFEETDFNVQLVTVLAVVAGDYDVEINGRSHVYTASGGESLTNIRDALVSRINNGPEPVTATTSGSAALKLKADNLPPAFTAGAQGPGPNDLSIVPIDSSLYWTQNEQAATI
jgi:hypothetical protein